MAKAKKRTGTKRSSAKRASGRRAGPSTKGKTTSGPSVPLRDLIRDGMPRSSKAHHPPSSVPPSPWDRGRMRTAHGLRHGSTIIENAPDTFRRMAMMKTPMRKA